MKLKADIDAALEQIKNLALNDTDTEGTTEGTSDPELEYKIQPEGCLTSNARHITEIKMNMYQLWAMFGQLPRVYKKGHSSLMSNMKFYEYSIKGRNTDVFTIYAWADKEGFLKTRKWNIGATTKDTAAIQHFMDYLFLALRLYSEHYKCMENNIFTSKDKEVDMHLKKIKKELIENREALKSI
jgi:hypothetical protein